MRKFLPAIAALFLAALPNATPAAAAERTYSVTDFDRVEVNGPFKVSLVTGQSSAAAASGSLVGLDRLTIDVQGRTLRVRPNRSAWGGYPGDRPEPVTVRLRTRDLRAVSILGAGSLDVNRARGLKLDLALAGSGRLAIAEVQADNILVSLKGSGAISLAGAAKSLRATISGTGDFDAGGLASADVDIDASTAGKVTAGAVRSAKIRTLGSGDVEIVGAPSCTVQALGAGAVTCGR